MKVIRDGKKNRRLEKIQARKSFDTTMNSLYSGTQFLTDMAIRKIVNLANFNIRRLAHWVKTRSKKISRDSLAFLNKSFGTLGGLDTKMHFA